MGGSGGETLSADALRQTPGADALRQTPGADAPLGPATTDPVRPGPAEDCAVTAGRGGAAAASGRDRAPVRGGRAG